MAGEEVLRTLCGCLQFPEELMMSDRVKRAVRRHFRASPECVEKARASAIWQERQPVPEGDEGEDTDPL